MEFRILGPLEVHEQGRQLPIGGPKQRALLALLLLHANEAVSAERLIDELWGEQPPAGAAKTLQVHVSRLRRALGKNGEEGSANGILVTRDRGYLLRVEPGQLDLDRFQQLLEQGRQALAAGDAESATRTLREALALWRGRPLEDLAYEPFAQAEIRRLEELRLAAFEDRIEADLALGRNGDLVGELEAPVGEHPLRERLRGQLMLALYRRGRQAEALEVYRQARQTLAEELGLEPSGALQRLEKAILMRDPALDLRPQEASPATGVLRRHTPASRRPLALARSATEAVGRRGRWLVLAGILPLVAAAIVSVLELSGGPDKAALTVAASNSVALIDPRTNRLIADVPVGKLPTRVALGEGAVWVLNGDDRTVSEIDPRTKTVRTFAAGPNPTDLAVGGGSLWVMNGFASEVLQIDPESGAIDQTIALHHPGGGGIGYVGVQPGAVWLSLTVDVGAAYGATYLWRLDTAALPELRAVPARGGGGAIAFGIGSVWVRGEESLLRIDPRTLSQSMITIPTSEGAPPGQVGELAVGEGSVWVTDTHNGTFWRVDPATNQPTMTIPVGVTPTGVAAGDGSVWVADTAGGTVSRIDPASNEIVASIKVGNAPRDVAVGDGIVWVTVD